MFEIDDEVMWFDFVGSFVPNYGKIISLTPKYADILLTPKHADILNFETQIVVRVRQTLLNWS